MNGKQLNKRILQWAIQGKLVPHDPNDEPASVLLERIREEKARLVKEKKIKKDKNESIIFRGDDNSHYEKFADGTVKCIDDEIPFEIPQSWEWTRICNITQSYIGLTYSPSEVSSQGTIVLRSSNIKNGKLDLCDIVRVSKEIPEKLRVAPNDIIICARNGSKRLVGKSAIVDTVNEPMTFGAFMAICKTPLYKYIYQFLQSDLFFSQLRDVSGTTTINQLTQNNFNAFLVPIPPIEEQQRIVERIEEIMPIADKYEKSQEALDKLNAEIFDKLKKSVLQEAIQGKLETQDPNDEPASVLLERIKEVKAKLFKEGKLKKKDLVDSVIFKGDDNKYYEKVGSEVTCIDDDIPFEIPSSWSWIRLGNYTDVIGGYAFQSQDLKSENGCRVIRISDISEDGLVNNRIVRYNGKLDLSQYRIYNSDILMAMTGGTVGKSLLLKSDNKEVLLLNQRVAIIRNTWFDVNYIDTVIKSAYIKSVIDNNKNSTNDNISMADITGFLIPIPPLNEQHRIINKIEFVIASITRR